MSIKKMLLVVLACTFLFASASLYAAAPAPHFLISGTQFIVRQHGQNEVVGDLILTNNLSGSAFPANSQILIAFFATGNPVKISNYTGAIAQTFSTATNIVNPARVAYVQSEQNSLGVSNITFTGANVMAGQAHILQIGVTQTANIAFGEVIRIEGIRLDIGDSIIGQGPEITVLGLGGVVDAVVLANPPGSFQIDNVNQVNVANTLTEYTLTTKPASAILACLGFAKTASYTITEVFSQAFTTVTDENDPSRTPTGAGRVPAVNGVRFTFTFSGLPPGVRIAAPASVTGTGSLVMTLISTTPLTSSASVSSLQFTYETTADSLSTIESFTPVFTFSLTSAFPNPVPPYPGNTWFGSVTLGPNLSPSNILSFVPVTKPVPPAAIGSVNICVTNLLCKFLTTMTGFDTGIALANTSKDIFGTTPQNGACRVNYFGNNGTGGNTAFTSPTVIPSGSVAPGTDYTFLVSTYTGPLFAGYAIIQCDFQFAHAEVIVADKYFSTFSHGYDCLVIPDPNVNAYGGYREPSGSGFITPGSGESLGQKRAGN